MGAGYRVRQFFKALTAGVTPAERERMAEILPPAGRELFQSLPRQDQRHGIDVLGALVAAGESDRELWAAALLHDCGKAGAGLTVFHRAAVVLLNAGRPAWLERLAARERRFGAQQQHAEIGAGLAQEAGCSVRTVWLIRHHHGQKTAGGEGPDAAALDALRRADEVS